MTLRSWAKKSRWSLVTVAIAIPAATLAAFSIDWPDYAAASDPHPTILAEGDTGTFENVTFQLTGHEVVAADSDEGRELGALAGSEVLIVTLHIDATKVDPDDAVGCDFELVAPGPSGERSWTPDSPEISLPYGGDAYKNLCILSDAEEFELKQAFALPIGTADQVSLRFSGSSLFPPTLQWDW